MSHHCQDEHHEHGGHDHEHDHSDDVTPALEHSLYQHIIFDQIQTLNEESAGSGRGIVKKTWYEKNSVEPELRSSADEQLLIEIPFTGQVKLHSILIRTGTTDSAPRTLHVFANRDDMDFAEAEDSAATQTFELPQSNDVQELSVKRAQFARTRKLTLFFSDNYGDGEEDVTKILYLAFKGDWMQTGRAPTNIIYEAAANPSDHALKGTASKKMGSDIGGGGHGF
ncbi:hypothetical protein BROUX41_000216 [Berkeleyomyces rouxiae]|uniref:uncharacterized protein n=1 Tax=Berkeleyomyces rouxiae TaxID=2035830 RepID=UPI003B780002